MQILTRDSLIDTIGKVLILAYKEPTEALEQYFLQEGFVCEVCRQENKPEYQEFSSSYRVLLNHCNAWEQAKKASTFTLIVEADFAPVRQFARLPLPFPKDNPDVGVSWIYNCAPQVYWVSPEGYAEGFSVSTVAYIVTPKGAECLLELAARIERKTGGKVYSAWDSEIDTVLRSYKLVNFIPFRNYGEHGGIPNPEHRQHGLSPGHQADVLWGDLALKPLYSDRDNIFSIRFKARLKGIGRLLLGRFLRKGTLQNTSTPWRLIRFAFFRQFTLRI
ncbi:MAG: LPS biosynthesis glycosyltransferase [Cyanobacteria bacterium P01_E01_bin.42]